MREMHDDDVLAVLRSLANVRGRTLVMFFA